MIKFNIQGHGLTAGLREQVNALVDAMKLAEVIYRVRVRLSVGSNILNQIRRVRVYCAESGKDTTVTQKVLEPFLRLSSIREVSIDGAVTEEYTTYLESKMTRKLDHGNGR